MSYRFPNEPIPATLIGKKARNAVLIYLVSLALFTCVGFAALGAESPDLPIKLAGLITCKPPVTGSASGGSDQHARSKATYAWLARVETEYGRSFVDVELTRGASWRCGRDGSAVVCRVAAQPCRLAM